MGLTKGEFQAITESASESVPIIVDGKPLQAALLLRNEAGDLQIHGVTDKAAEPEVVGTPIATEPAATEGAIGYSGETPGTVDANSADTGSPDTGSADGGEPL